MMYPTSVYGLGLALSVAVGAFVGKVAGEGAQGAVILLAYLLWCSAGPLWVYARRVPPAGFYRWAPNSGWLRRAHWVAASWLLFGALVELLPWYHAGLLGRVDEAVRLFWLVAVVASYPYAYWVRGPASAPVDLALGAILKAVFMPLMWSLYVGANHAFYIADFSALLETGAWWSAPLVLVVLVDVTIGAVGYTVTAKPLGAPVNHVSRSLAEWVVTVACYYPYWSYVHQFMPYGGPGWQSHVQVGTWQADLWAAAVVLLHVLWLYSTVSHGHRFANLAHRGIITDGLFRWMPHPSYTIKVLMYWVSVVPFLGPSPVVETLGLVACSMLYWARGSLETRRLMHDPEYRRYRHDLRNRWRSRAELAERQERPAARVVLAS